MGDGIILGVDGGGTRSTAIAVDQSGRVLAKVMGESLNYHNIGIRTARSNLKATVDDLLCQSGYQEYLQLVVGLSALDSLADRQMTREFAGELFNPDRLTLESDAYVALMGVTLGEAGAIVICGTGSMILLVDREGKEHVRGGWGTTLGDACSSYSLALGGMRASIAAQEGYGKETGLVQAVLEYFNIRHLRDMINIVYNPQCTPAMLAGFAPQVLRLAKEGDEAAGQILRREADVLIMQASSLLQAHPDVSIVGIHGGIFQHNTWVGEEFSNRLQSATPNVQVIWPEYPPEVGAVMYALKKRGKLTSSILKTIKKSFLELDNHVCH